MDTLLLYLANEALQLRLPKPLHSLQLVRLLLCQQPLLLLQLQTLHSIVVLHAEIRLQSIPHAMLYRIAQSTKTGEAQCGHGKIARVRHQSACYARRRSRSHPRPAAISQPLLEVVVGAIEHHTAHAERHRHRRHVQLNGSALQHRNAVSRHSSSASYSSDSFQSPTSSP